MISFVVGLFVSSVSDMDTNAPSAKCMVCGKPVEYRAAASSRLVGMSIVFGRPTEWIPIFHLHTQAEIDAWVSKGLKVGVGFRDSAD